MGTPGPVFGPSSWTTADGDRFTTPLSIWMLRFLPSRVRISLPPESVALPNIGAAPVLLPGAGNVHSGLDRMAGKGVLMG